MTIPPNESSHSQQAQQAQQPQLDQQENALISCRGLNVTYPNGHHALRGIDLDLHGGKIYGLVGANGAGKSTLFKSLMGLIQPSQGSIKIDEKSIKIALKNNLVSYVPQSEAIDWDFPILVRDVVMMGRYSHMNFMRIARQKDKEIAAKSLDMVGLTGYETRQIGELSGGQRKRVFLARALAQQTRIMFLDEPFTGIDTQSEHDIIAILRQLRDAGKLILISTHNLQSIPQFCDDVVFIKNHVIAKGNYRKLMTQYT